jgi:hypothetical protein
MSDCTRPKSRPVCSCAKTPALQTAITTTNATPQRREWVGEPATRRITRTAVTARPTAEATQAGQGHVGNSSPANPWTAPANPSRTTARQNVPRSVRGKGFEPSRRGVSFDHFFHRYQMIEMPRTTAATNDSSSSGHGFGRIGMFCHGIRRTCLPSQISPYTNSPLTQTPATTAPIRRPSMLSVDRVFTPLVHPLGVSRCMVPATMEPAAYVLLRTCAAGPARFEAVRCALRHWTR